MPMGARREPIRGRRTVSSFGARVSRRVRMYRRRSNGSRRRSAFLRCMRLKTDAPSAGYPFDISAVAQLNITSVP